MYIKVSLLAATLVLSPATAAVIGRSLTLSSNLFELAIHESESAAAAACATMWS